MLTFDHVNELAETMLSNGIESLEVSGTGYSVRLVRAPGASNVVVDAQGVAARLTKAISPASGAFVPRGGDDGFPVLIRGAQVTFGEPLGYVGSGPLRFVCASPAPGTLKAAPPTEGTMVHAGDTLFVVEAEA